MDIDRKVNIKVNMKGEEYSLITNYKDDVHLRHSLNRLTQKTYGFDFEQWYQQGYWTDRYRPYSFLHNNEIVANISVNPIDFLVNGELHHTVQIGTVMTDMAYRHRGLSKALMNLVLEQYENTCELFYLYANNTVLDFYPKFGFTTADEYVYIRQFKESSRKLPFRKIDMNYETDKAMIARLVNRAKPVSQYAMVHNPQLIMFYLTSFMAGDIYYFEDQDLAAVAAWREDELILMDLFCEKGFDLEQVINSLMKLPKCKVVLGFTPMERTSYTGTSYTAEFLQEEGSTFFVKGKNFLDKGRFSILSHA
ncbi:MAG TPA: GNAT family N-acetyltransferase [Mobilitalea sp.]|nr:GNAT family N-acetyltransferase [Mobilitalea sp.]